jgi:hypothetical protein
LLSSTQDCCDEAAIILASKQSRACKVDSDCQQARELCLCGGCVHNARPVSTKAVGKASASMRMNVLMVSPTIVTRTRFAQTQKGATPVPARMGIKT